MASTSNHHFQLGFTKARPNSSLTRFLFRSLAFSPFCLLALLLLPLLASGQSPTAQSTQTNQWEKVLLSVPSPERLRATLRTLTAKPHMAGTPEDYETALYTRSEMEKAGLKTEIVEYEVWLPYPKSRLVEMVQPKKFKASLIESPLTEDKDSSTSRAVPTFSAYSPSGDVTGEVVYANFGLQNDYEELKKKNINVQGKIVLVRYGGAFRGVKAKIAEENGAVGLLIYSDPKEDGFVRGDLYPNGPFRPDSAVQQGSITYISQYPGDPLTPGKPSIKSTKRIKPEEATNLPRIPVQPLSYKDALPILEQIGGPNVPADWQGGLPLPYHLGPGPAQVHLKLEMDFQQRKIWNVIGTIPGATFPDEWILFGNHRDAWVYGAVDPSSGSAVLLETARSFGELLKKGWKPQRTIVFCSWDGEEFGMIGSTEWAEEHAEELQKKAVVYFNSDSAVSGGNFFVSAVPSLWLAIKSVAQDVLDASGNQTIYNTWKERNPNAIDMNIGQMGGGSDFMVFLNHLGIPSMMCGLTGDYGVYHSVYDSFHWMEKFGDPNFTRHTTMTRMWGLLLLRFADSPGIPLNTSEYAHELLRFCWEIDKDFKWSREKPDLTLMTAAATQLVVRTEAFEKAGDTPATLVERNQARRNFERAFIDPTGLPGRSWYRHVVFAPGVYSGYGAEAFSGLRHSLNQKQAADAKRAADQITAALNRATEMLK